MEKQLQLQQNPFDDEPGAEVIEEAPVLHLISEDRNEQQKEMINLRKQIKEGLEKKNQVTTTRAELGGYKTLPDDAIIPEDKKKIDDLPHQQERLALLEEKFNATLAKQPLLKRLRSKVASLFLNL